MTIVARDQIEKFSKILIQLLGDLDAAEAKIAKALELAQPPHSGVKSFCAIRKALTAGSAAEEPQLKRFYVSMTWEDWPEGGSYGTVVQALGHAAAESACKIEMADLRSEEDIDSDSWHLVDCFDLDEFITHYMQP
jgi:hypothetical protein